mgnify:CR=1 FL=1
MSIRLSLISMALAGLVVCAPVSAAPQQKNGEAVKTVPAPQKATAAAPKKVVKKTPQKTSGKKVVKSASDKVPGNGAAMSATGKGVKTPETVPPKMAHAMGLTRRPTQEFVLEEQPEPFYYRQKNAFACLATSFYVPSFVVQVQNANEKLADLNIATKEGLAALSRYRKARLEAAVMNDKFTAGRTGAEKFENLERDSCIKAAIARGRMYVLLNDTQRDLLDKIEDRSYRSPIVSHKPEFDRRRDSEAGLDPQSGSQIYRRK